MLKRKIRVLQTQRYSYENNFDDIVELRLFFILITRRYAEYYEIVSTIDKYILLTIILNSY